MSTTVKYKGNTLTTVSNATKTLKTAGKYMEGDVSIIDSSGNEQGTVWQDAEGYLHLDDESGISLQTKSATPSETAQTIQPDAGYYALDKVNVSAISSTYVGSGITRRSSTDLTASGAKVTVPAGYYSAAASKSIDNASLTFSSISNNEPTIASTNNKLTLYANVDVRTYNDSVGGYVASGSEVLGTAQVFLYSDKPFFNDNSGLTVSGATVTVPAGYYSSSVSKSVSTMTLPTAAATSATSGYTKKATIGRSTSKQYINIAPGYNSTGGYYEISAVANGSASAPTSISGSTATVSTGTNTLTLTKTVSVTPVVSAGYISSGTATNSSVSLTASVTVDPTPTASGATVTIPAGYYTEQTTKSVTTMTLPTSVSSSATSGYTKKATISRSTSKQYINIAPGYNSAGGYYEISAVANGTAGTPTATKGTVSNHSISVTPSVTNTTGYITGGTKTGTAVSVSASELVSGTKSITENGTDIDVTNYASVDVNVSGGYTVSLNYNKYYGESYAYVEHKGVRYSQQTEFTIGKDDEITLYAGYMTYVDGRVVASRSSGITTYTFAPKDNINIIINGTNSNYVILRAGRETKGLVNILFDVGCIDSFVNDFYIPDYVTSIGSYAFYNRFSIGNRSLSFHDGIKKIGEYAFYNCKGLSITSLPNTISEIGPYAFYDCTNLTLTSLPSGLTQIAHHCFSSCTNLALTSLPSNLTQIDEGAFSNCSSLSITELPQNISTLTYAAFSGCTNIELTRLPSNLTSIEGYAFNRCIKITSLRCDGPLSNIAADAFTGSSSSPMVIEEIYFPNSVIDSLGTAFGSTTAANACTALRILDIGSVTRIKGNALANCNALTTLILRKSNAIATLANVSAFLNTPMRGYNSLTGTVYVPSALISSYQTATNWSTLYNNGTVNFVAIEGSEYEL